MKKLIIACMFLLPVAAGMLLAGCRKEQRELSSYEALDETKKDTLRIYNLLPDLSVDGMGTGYQVYLNDSLIRYAGMGQWDFTFGAIPYVMLPAEGGTFNIKLTKYSYYYDTPVVKNPPASVILAQETITVPPNRGSGYMVFYDDNGVAAVKYIPVESPDPGAPAPGNFKIRVINFSYDMADYSPSYPENSAGRKFELSLRYADSTDVPGMSNIPFAGMSEYREVPYGMHQFFVHNNTDGQYLNNCGVMEDATKTFDIYPVSIDPSTPYNRVFPSIATGFYDDSKTLQVFNIGSYPFAAGNCYTILVIGRIYAVLTDLRYTGTLDDFGKVQVVNTDPNQQNVDVKIAYQGGEKTQRLSFGGYTEPVTVPAGKVDVTFSVQGNTLHHYTGEVTRLANLTWYYMSDLNKQPFVMPVSNTITALDYRPATFYTPAMIMMSKVKVLNLIPDAGKVFFTHYPFLFPTQEGNVSGEIAYRASAVGTSYDGTQPPARIALRLSASRKDSLAAKEVASIQHIFPTFPAPGSYTLVAAGLLNTTDPAKGIHLFMIKHTNFITKAK